MKYAESLPVQIESNEENLDFIHQMKIDGYGVIDNFLPSDIFDEIHKF